MLSDQDVREILRLIDESDLDELLIETDGFKLHVLRGVQSAESREQSAESREPNAHSLLSAPTLCYTCMACKPGSVER